jgi:hypothetical protein
LVSWQRNGPADYSTCGLHSLNNFLSGLIDQIVIVRLEFYADFLSHEYLNVLSLERQQSLFPEHGLAHLNSG